MRNFCRSGTNTHYFCQLAGTCCAKGEHRQANGIIEVVGHALKTGERDETLMRVDIVSRGPILVAALIGELDHHTAERVRITLDSELDKWSKPKLVLDLSGLTFMDSSGLGVVLGRYRRLKNQGGAMAIAGVEPSVERLFALSGLYKIMSIYPVRDEAVRALKEAFR